LSCLSVIVRGWSSTPVPPGSVSRLTVAVPLRAVVQPFFVVLLTIVVLLAILCYANRLACGSDRLGNCAAGQTFT
jgi:hypothetical protein